MMALRTSRRSRAILVRADGSIEPLALDLGLFQPVLVVLARERCLFERLDIASSMKSSAALAAARLQAETGSPYQRPGSLITRRGSAFGVWWWDAQWLGETLVAAGYDATVKVMPEPMARAGAEGWRIVKATTGYEAQLWRGGFLVADAWRRRAYDDADWQGFTRVQQDQAGAGPTALMAQDPPFTLQNPYRRTQLSDWTPERTMQAAVLAVGVILISSAAWLGGQAVALNKAAKLAETQAANIRARTPRTGAVQTEVAALTKLRGALGGPDPMVMLENAQQLMQPFGHKLVAFNAERTRVRVILPEDAASDLAPMSRKLMTSPFFASVKPQLDTKRGRLIIDLIPKNLPKVEAKAPAAKA